MNANMKVSEQCRNATSNGNKVLGMIRRNITYKEKSLIIPLYKAIVIYSIICLKSVDVRRMQFAIIAQSPREMALTDSILPRYFLSRVRVSIRPRFVYTPKKKKQPAARSHASAPPTVRTAQFETQFIPSRQVATYVRGGYG